MKPFTYYNPTRLVFGRGRIAELRELLPKDTRILVTYGGGSVKRNGVYEQVEAALEGFDHVEFWGIEPNPKVETLEKAIELGRREKAGFVLSVGGGSVLDGSKLIACALALPEGTSAWELVLSRRPKACLPYADVMTLPATGSEMNDNGVISRLATDEKISFVAPRHPEFSILDPDTCRSLPKNLMRASLADIVAHVLEQYLTQPGQSRTMDRWAEGILHTVIEIAPKLLAERPASDAVLDDYMLSATLALNEMIAMGVNQDWATHAIGHEITAFTGTPHGASLALVFPALCRVRFGLKKNKLAQMGERIFGLVDTDRDSLARGAIESLEDFFASLGLPTRLDEAGIPVEVDAKIVERFRERGWKLGEDRAMTVDEIAAVLRAARPCRPCRQGC